MRTGHIFLLCILAAALLSSVICKNEVAPEGCCFGFYPRTLNKNLIRSYYMTDRRCTKSGVILLTRKNRRICADPTLPWVENIMKSLDKRSF